MSLRVLAMLFLGIILFISAVFVYYEYFDFREVKTLIPEYTIYKIKPRNKNLDLINQNQDVVLKSSQEEKPLMLFEDTDNIDSILEDLYVNQGQTQENLMQYSESKRHDINHKKFQNYYLVEIGFFDNLFELEKFKDNFKLKYGHEIHKLNFIIQKQNFKRSFFVLNVGYYKSLHDAQKFCKLLSANAFDCLIQEIFK